MRLCLLALFAVGAVSLAGQQSPGLSQAKADYERVVTAPVPAAADAARCIQSQAGVLAVASVAEQPLIHYQKGYCTLAAGEFAAAAVEFDKAAAAWRANSTPKKPAEPVPSPLFVLSAVARLKAGTSETTLQDAEKDINLALAQPSCSLALMSLTACDADLTIGREWLGWLDQRSGNYVAAAREFKQTPDSAWQEWVAFRQAFEGHHFPQAVAYGRRAIDEWDRQRSQTATSFNDSLRPQPDMADFLTRWAGAQLLAGDPAAAITTLNRAVKVSPSLARAYYLRGRAKEIAGRPQEALADYNMASRTAYAEATDLASGEAHLYSGILAYRRKDFVRAESEFSSALNFSIPASLRPDAAAWRLLAAVETGACENSRASLARALGTVSPYFPGQEAKDAMTACPASTASLTPPERAPKPVQ
jgi:tetratricopeptide (TPR) repeat protein